LKKIKFDPFSKMNQSVIALVNPMKHIKMIHEKDKEFEIFFVVFVNMS